MTQLIATDGAQYRIDRLCKTLRVAREIIALSEQQTKLLIHSIEDRRGRLLVRWVAEPTARQREAFSAAWELVGERASSVAHAGITEDLEWNA